MKKVITINLNGNAYQLEEGGYDKLKAYLDQAAVALASNPDKEEILRDLQQAIAEKSQAYLNPAKNVIATEEIEAIIKSMGPVEGSADQGSGAKAGAGTAGDAAGAQSGSPKKLYLLREGALLMGVCNGLAAYFNIDVTLVRVAFVLLTAFTSGGFIGVYVILAIVIPYAKTPDEHAAAHGFAFTAQQLINRAKMKYETFTANKGWQNTRSAHEAHKTYRAEWKKAREERKRMRREQKMQWRHAARMQAYARNPLLDTFNALIWLAVLGAMVWASYTYVPPVHRLVDQGVAYLNTL